MIFFAYLSHFFTFTHQMIDYDAHYLLQIDSEKNFSVQPK